MITAIPLTHDRLSNHFTKADQFMFVNEQGQVMETIVNPASGANANCSGKSDLFALLKAKGTTRVLVKNIGERMFGRLVNAGITVLQANNGRQDVFAMLSEANFSTMTAQDKVRPSVNYQKKQASGGCCHHHGESCTEDKHPFIFAGRTASRGVGPLSLKGARYGHGHH